MKKTKKGKLDVYYDEEGDYLEIVIGKPTPCTMESIGNDIFQRIENKTGKVKGFAIVNFKKRSNRKVVHQLLSETLEASA